MMIKNKRKKEMNVEQLSKELNISIHYIEHHFPRIRDSMRKQGIILVKSGKGKNAQYGIGKVGEVHVKF